MGNNKKVSVVIPAYNEESYIGACLNSLANQTLDRRDYEIVVVDGGSEDETVDIAREYADNVIIQHSKGVGGARNDGVEVSSGEIVAMTDADIILPCNWLEESAMISGLTVWLLFMVPSSLLNRDSNTKF